MINPQLLDYIRQQLAGGVSKEDTVKSLIANGWQVPDINEAFSSLEKAPSIPLGTVPAIVPNGSVNTVWTKNIPRTNKIFMVLSLVLVFGLDLFIIISNPSLASFWSIMLAILAVFVVFFCLENFVFSKKFANTTSSVDKWISMIIAIRNLIFVLNFIPLIQLLGLALLGGFLAIIPRSLIMGGGGLGDLGGLGSVALIVPALFVVYIVLIISRFKTAKGATH